MVPDCEELVGITWRVVWLWRKGRKFRNDWQLHGHHGL